MKKIFSVIAAAACLTFSFTSCEALFDNLEGDLTKMTGEDMASSEAGIQMLLAEVYSFIPMDAFQPSSSTATKQHYFAPDQYTMNACDSHGGDYGFNSVPYYGTYGIVKFEDWAKIRSINNFIQIVEDATAKGIITPDNGKVYAAEAKFARAYCYFAMVRSLGGVPIITEPLDKYYDGQGNVELFAKAERATEEATWDFVISELEAAAADLPEVAKAEFRASKYAALGLEVRAALYAASVSKYWENGKIASTKKAVAAKKTYMDKSMAPKYYNKCIEAAEKIINSGKFSLYGANPASVDEAVKNLGDMFVTKQNCEFIFGKSFNDGISSKGSAFDVYNSPAQTVTGASDCGKYSVTVDFADKFDNIDAAGNAYSGIIPTRADGKETEVYNGTIEGFTGKETNYVRYANIDDPFKNKEARFKAWVLYPDAFFRNQTIKIQGGLIKTNGEATFWGDDQETVDGKTYFAYGDNAGVVSGFYNYMNTMGGNSITTGFGLRKFLNPDSFQLYFKGFWYDLRYAEILLSYCEAVVESGNAGKTATAQKYLNDIRHRAAFKDNVELTLDEVLHQRELELAFENDQLYTLHRRRAFYNSAKDPAYMGAKHALTPVLDLSSGKPEYIFIRTVHYAENTNFGGKKVNYSTDVNRYYGEISNYGVNGYEPNPIND